MICAEFLLRDGHLCGFSIRGHAGADAQGKDIVCAAVSSAVYMAANTVTDVCGCKAHVHEGEGLLTVSVAKADEQKAQIILQGLMLHVQGLSAQYPQYIQVQQTEV